MGTCNIRSFVINKVLFQTEADYLNNLFQLHEKMTTK